MPEFPKDDRPPFQVIVSTDNNQMAEVSPIKPKEKGKKQSDFKNPESSDEVVEERCYYSEQKGSKKIQN